MKRIYLFALAWFAYLNQTHANAICKENFDSYQDIISCAEAKSPDIQTSKIEVERATTQIQAAGQWRNPDLSAETFQGRFGAQERSETDFSFSVPIELGDLAPIWWTHFYAAISCLDSYSSGAM